MNFLIMFEGVTKRDFNSIVKEVELNEKELPIDITMSQLNEFLIKKYDLVNVDIHRIKTKGENKND